MALKVNFSNNYWAMIKRIQRLPKLLENTIDTITKKDAINFVETYKDGIRNNSFHLEKLADITVKQKRRLGYKKPYTSLYGAGDDKKNSYINAIRIRKIKKGYRAFISSAKHHKTNLPLNVIFTIHENGALIKKGDKYIRIPPRPTRAKAFRRFLSKKIKNENTKKVRDKIIEYIRTGTYNEIKN